MGVRILCQDGVEHRVGNLIAYLIRMPFRYRFGGEKSLGHWIVSPFLFPIRLCIQANRLRYSTKSAPAFAQGASKRPLICRQSAAGFGTLYAMYRLPGFIGPVPSTALDKESVLL